MNIEQLSIDDVLNRHIVYEHLPNNESIYCKIDWLTFVFNNCSVNDVLYWIGEENDSHEYLSQAFEFSRGFVDAVSFSFNGIRLEAPRFSFYQSGQDCPAFDVLLPSIRLELSGSALDYLRSKGLDFYELRFSRPFISSHGSGEFHCTRCDWAFDFINYKPEFVDELITYLQHNSLRSGRVPIISDKRSAIKYSLKLGDQKTVYLGATTSDQLLRVYDKRMQYVDLNTGIYKIDNPYNNPNSWFRIELQTRNKIANSFLMSFENGKYNRYSDILKYVYEHYAFADSSVDGNNIKRQSVEFWQRLLPWNEIEKRIIQNAKYVQPLPLSEFIINSFVRSSSNVICSFALKGIDALECYINEYLRSCDPGHDVLGPSALRRRVKLLSRLDELTIDVSNNYHIYNDQGKLFFSIIPLPLVPYWKAYKAGLLPDLPASVLYSLEEAGL